MPTYEYKCTACNHGFEIFQSMADAPLTVCPSCGKKVRRIIGSGTGIIFKGSGFYINDSRKSGSASPEAAPASPAAASASPAVASADTVAKKEAV